MNGKGNYENLSIKIAIIGIVASAVLSIPSWLPVFGIEIEWFGNSIVVSIQGFLPVIMFVGGFVSGRCIPQTTSKRRIKKEKLDRQQRDFLSHNIDQRTMVFLIYEKGPYTWPNKSIKGSEYDSKYVMFTDMGEGKTKITINPAYSELFRKRRNQCFDGLEEEIERILKNKQ